MSKGIKGRGRNQANSRALEKELKEEGGYLQHQDPGKSL